MFNSTEITGYHTFSTLSWIIKLHQSSLIQGTCVLYITEGLSSLVSEVRVNILWLIIRKFENCWRKSPQAQAAGRQSYASEENYPFYSLLVHNYGYILSDILQEKAFVNIVNGR